MILRLPAPGEKAVDDTTEQFKSFQHPSKKRKSLAKESDVTMIPQRPNLPVRPSRNHESAEPAIPQRPHQDVTLTASTHPPPENNHSGPVRLPPNRRFRCQWARIAAHPARALTDDGPIQMTWSDPCRDRDQSRTALTNRTTRPDSTISTGAIGLSTPSLCPPRQARDRLAATPLRDPPFRTREASSVAPSVGAGKLEGLLWAGM